MQDYVRTDTAHAFVSTLKLAHVFHQCALEDDDRYWKDDRRLHSAAQSTEALALEPGAVGSGEPRPLNEGVAEGSERLAYKLAAPNPGAAIVGSAECRPRLGVGWCKPFV